MKFVPTKKRQPNYPSQPGWNFLEACCPRLRYCHRVHAAFVMTRDGTFFHEGLSKTEMVKIYKYLRNQRRIVAVPNEAEWFDQILREMQEYIWS